LSHSCASPSVSVIIPTLNEARNLREVFVKLPAQAEIVLVDGNSTDDTVRVARELRPDVIVVHQTRYGKGNALACGVAAASGDVVVMLDADGSTDPAEIPAFVEALTRGADFAKGTRFSRRGGSSDITMLRTLGNLFLCQLVNLLFRSKFTDLCYGYNAFWRRCLPMLELPPGESDGVQRYGDGFEIETLMILRAAIAGLRVAEVGSYEHKRLHGASNLRAGRDGLRVLRTIFVEWSRSRTRLREPIIGYPPLETPVIPRQVGPADLPHSHSRPRHPQTTSAADYT
jgi:glycosyltransferase involved in cell wall biosynthesis